MHWFNFATRLVSSLTSHFFGASPASALTVAPCCVPVCMNATGPALSASPNVLAVTAVASIASRTVASALSVTSASASASASSLPDNDISAGDGALAALLLVPIVFVLWLWMIISKPAIIFYGSQAFFNFIAMCCFASVASFQAKWDVGPSGLSGFAVFVSVATMLLSLFLLFVPVIDVKYGKLSRLSRALSETRVAFILTVTGTTLDLLIAFITTISAWTQKGCKNPDDDPHSDLGDDFKNGLGGWCSTKKAGAIFFWLAFAAWCGTLTLNILSWRSGKARHPRDPPFNPPVGSEQGVYDELEEEEDESTYGRPAPLRGSSTHADSPFTDGAAVNRNSQAPSYTLPPVSGVGSFNPSGVSSAAGSIPAARSSVDAYGAFSDPAPSGYGGTPPVQQQSFGTASGLDNMSPGGVSRTMQYADPYAAVRASIAGGPAPSTYSTPSSAQGPPSYTEYTGYR
ncbi:hypothetical protein ACEPAH_7972 [Sanghuangporus vaninii]